ncbi:helix-turn-helix domain-containing protein [Pseudonocardiaceae bacterium YIM PH 21723]|nr:helix-turn-helix domain-containing protein [Pseudonocardiaceae bacterium YIM PH 21723]
MSTNLRYASTESVPPADRVAYWEEHNRRALVGLSVTSYSEHGLLAAQTNARLGRLWVTEIRGNEHVIERTPRICRAWPRAAVFASLVTSGNAVHFHAGGAVPVANGQLVLYRTDQPYLFGFSSPMRQLLVDIPEGLFADRCARDLAEPQVLGGGSAAERATIAALRTELASASSEDTVLDLIGSLAGRRTGGPAALLAGAREYIRQHLADPGLSPEQVAAAINISVRHLGRTFAADGVSPARYIQRERLAAAHAELTTRRSGTIAEVAYRWGFASQAHFTRAFRDHYGHTPSEARG